MIHRALEGKPALITFAMSFRHVAVGDLQPGKDFSIYYDAERLPNERSTHQGKPAWSITAYVKFSETDQPHPYVLESRTGRVRRKITDRSGCGTIMEAHVPVPLNASEVILWFVNTGRSGAVYYDSDYGRNYWFRFVQNDIRVLSDELVSNPEMPYSGFGVQVSAAPALTGVSVHYRVLNMPKNPMEATVPLQMTGPSAGGNLNLWSIAKVVVPYRSVISFDILYSTEGRTFIDDNHGRGYLATPS
ncbi:MAG: DUF6209 family protein [Isosphaeraceae bacterium]|jgi:hypothetical protein